MRLSMIATALACDAPAWTIFLLGGGGGISKFVPQDDLKKARGTVGPRT